MPFKSERQRRFLWANHPEIAKRWTKESKGREKMAISPVAAMAIKQKRKKEKEEDEDSEDDTYSAAVARRLQNLKPSSYSK